MRLLCVPVFLWILFGHHPHDRYHAALLLAAMGITDWVDGYLARHLHQVSTLGKVLDPIADRLLLGVGVVAILIDGSAPAVDRPGRRDPRKASWPPPPSSWPPPGPGGSTSSGPARREPWG